MWLVALALALVALLVAPPRARADVGPSPDPVSLETSAGSSDPSVAAAALFSLGEAADARGDYGPAAARYRAAVARLPSFRYAAKAITRAALLEAHSEGSWGPFTQLEAIRRDPNASNDPGAIDALARSTDTFPPGPTRSEARMLCAEAYISRLHRRADGEAALRKVIDDSRADGLLRRQAASELVTAMIDDGDLTAAQATVVALGRTLDRAMAQRVSELRRRRRAHLASIADLVLFALFATLAIGRAASRGTLAAVGVALRKMLPLGIAFAAYMALVGGGLASGYETGNAEPFFAFGAVLVPVAVAARAWGAAGSTGTAARAGRAVMSGSAVVAAAFLTLEAINGQYLEGFNL